MDTQNTDVQLSVEFYVDPVENMAKSREAGRPIFEDREFIRIRFPADNKRELVAPADEVHYVQAERAQMKYSERFHQHYAAFKAQNVDFVSGTPLSEAPFLTKSKVSELAALNVKTMEQLSGLPDATIRKIGMGARDLVDQAQAYLSSANNISEIAELKRQIAELQKGKSDEFSDFSDADLKNMIKDAGGDVPRGMASRETLINALKAIVAEKAA